MANFAITGVAGYIAPRHLQAMKEVGGELVAAVDPHDSVGILDSYFPTAAFFTEFERFDRHVEKLRRLPSSDQVHYLSICSPNHLHDAHIRLALRIGASAICEKPLVVNPWNLDALAELEAESAGRVHTILQLRVHPKLLALRERLASEPGRRRQVRLTYITARGTWYRYSWKGNADKSGGVATNIGIHFFDLLLWLFGRVERSEVHLSEPERLAGGIELANADVDWFLSVNERDLPQGRADGQPTYRSITIDGEEIEFSGGFRDLHTRIYEEILAGRGFGIEDARPSIELVHEIRRAPAVKPQLAVHPMLTQLQTRRRGGSISASNRPGGSDLPLTVESKG
ncbi:MAG TPA: Gfo/Idh/MocA family oxidoreductase [Gemmatimonadaceae bacterium]|nr:Gfo/Idh/MocA family oxidoreductase [Gemmatimonadaceae bacterium]